MSTNAVENFGPTMKQSRAAKSVQFSTNFVVALDFFAQCIEDARHGDDDGDSLAFDRFHDL
jgi:hypothetical protein